VKTGTLLVLVSFVWLSYSCSGLRHAGSHGLQDGYYSLKTDTAAARPVYARITDEQMALHLRVTRKGPPAAQPFFETATGERSTDSFTHSFTLVKQTIDLDLGTVLFKYRFARRAVPNQLNSQLNFALYSGYRKDYYRFRAERTPLRTYRHTVRHFEFDIGVFAGLGATPVNPTVTNGLVAEEYDGIVWQKGVAFFIGSNSFTAGVGIGTDALLDRNRRRWLYQERPWLGVMIGLNLGD
jgi:hypothetical protein